VGRDSTRISSQEDISRELHDETAFSGINACIFGWDVVSEKDSLNEKPQLRQREMLRFAHFKSEFPQKKYLKFETVADAAAATQQSSGILQKGCSTSPTPSKSDFPPLVKVTESESVSDA
jgi:hypothetical protein